jgi:hypothetical protein
MNSNYFRPTVTIDADNLNDHSKMVGIVPMLLIPANVDRAGLVIQNHSETNDLWWGYDSSVEIGAPGYFRLKPNSPPFFFPTNGIYRGAIYCLSDGGSKVTCKDWSEQ